MIVKAQYLRCMQEKDKVALVENRKKQAIPTNNIVHPCIDVMAV